MNATLCSDTESVPVTVIALAVGGQARSLVQLPDGSLVRVTSESRLVVDR